MDYLPRIVLSWLLKLTWIFFRLEYIPLRPNYFSVNSKVLFNHKSFLFVSYVQEEILLPS